MNKNEIKMAVKGIALAAGCFLVGYGLASVVIDINKIRKA